MIWAPSSNLETVVYSVNTNMMDYTYNGGSGTLEYNELKAAFVIQNDDYLCPDLIGSEFNSADASLVQEIILEPEQEDSDTLIARSTSSFLDKTDMIELTIDSVPSPLNTVSHPQDPMPWFQREYCTESIPTIPSVYTEPDTNLVSVIRSR